MDVKPSKARLPFTEWGLYFCLSVCLAATGFFIASTRPGWPSHCLELASHGWHGGGCYVQLIRGDLWLYSYPDSGATGFVPPDLSAIPAEPLGPLLPGQSPWRRRSLTLPGFALHGVFYPTTESYPDWSLKVSLVLPAILSILAGAILLRRLRRNVAAVVQT